MFSCNDDFYNVQTRKYLLLILIFTILGVALVLSVGLSLIPNTNDEQEIPLMFLGRLVGNGAGGFLGLAVV